MKNFISIKEMTKDEILQVLDEANELENTPEPHLLDGKIVATLFFEPSTRTKLSFTSAAYKLGANVLGFDNPNATSLAKGESLADTIKVISNYADLIVMRHYIEGAAEYAKSYSHIPIINAGDGSHEHPSQTLLDLYTIQKEYKTLNDLKIAFIGDLKYGRTVHSLTRAFIHFNPTFYFVAPSNIQIPEYMLKELDTHNVKYNILDRYDEILNEIDVLYVTRIQRERFDDTNEYEKVKGIFVVKKDDIENKNLIVLHPLPRVDEIATDVDNLPQARYFEQAKNGVVVREAMYKLALNENEKNIDNIITTQKVCTNKKCVVNSEKCENMSKIENGKEFCIYCGKEMKCI